MKKLELAGYEFHRSLFRSLGCLGMALLFGVGLARAKAAKPETFIDNSILADLGNAGFVDRLYK